MEINLIICDEKKKWLVEKHKMKKQSLMKKRIRRLQTCWIGLDCLQVKGMKRAWKWIEQVIYSVGGVQPQILI